MPQDFWLYLYFIILKKVILLMLIVGLYAIPDTNSQDYPEWVHDHNITILNGGNLIWFLHLERISRIKYHSGFPGVLENLAREMKLIPANDKIFVFVDHEVGRSFISRSGKIRFEAPLNKQLITQPERGNFYWFGERPEAYVLNHELAHIYSCVPFYGQFKENSLLVHFDGGASKSNFSAWMYIGGELKKVEAHYKYKWLSSLFNANALVFKIVGASKKEQNAVPGKFMGLEAYGKYNAEIEKWLVSNDFFQNIWGSSKSFFVAVKKKFNISISDFDNKHPLIQDISATIHEVFLREMLLVFERLQEEMNAEYLYYSGGSALNIKLNARLLEKNLFKDIFIPPCTNDSGLSLGAATAINIMCNKPLEVQSPYLNNYKIEDYNSYTYMERDIIQVASEICEGKIVGICNGYSEIGPRALGNRSIIARADRKNIAIKLSQQIKKREWYRPVAPVMLLRNARYFTGRNDFPIISKFMLTEFKIMPDKTEGIEGCVHIDGTSRVQVIFKKEDNPYLYDLLDYLEHKHNIRALINTSFNRKGEPIVHTVENALQSAEEMHLDGLVLNGKYRKLV